MIIGIDPSLTGTSICIGEAIDKVNMQTFASKNIGDTARKRVDRYSYLIGTICDHIEKFPRPDAIYIEAYAFAAKGQSVTGICEFGGLLRWHLLDYSDRLIEVSPTALKKFIVGKGVAKKNMVAAHITKRYGNLFANDNEFDAFGLYAFGLAVEGIEEPPTADMRSTVDRFRDSLPADLRKEAHDRDDHSNSTEEENTEASKKEGEQKAEPPTYTKPF